VEIIFFIISRIFSVLLSEMVVNFLMALCLTIYYTLFLDVLGEDPSKVISQCSELSSTRMPYNQLEFRSLEIQAVTAWEVCSSLGQFYREVVMAFLIVYKVALDPELVASARVMT